MFIFIKVTAYAVSHIEYNVVFTNILIILFHDLLYDNGPF